MGKGGCTSWLVQSMLLLSILICMMAGNTYGKMDALIFHLPTSLSPPSLPTSLSLSYSAGTEDKI